MCKNQDLLGKTRATDLKSVAIFDGICANWLGTCGTLSMKEYSYNIWPDIYRQKNISRTEEVLTQYQYTVELYKWLNPIHSAKRILKILVQDYADLIYITGRPLSTKAVTKEWLATHGFPKAQVINVRDSKVPAVQRTGVDIFIEDRMKYAQPLSENGISVYLLDVYDRKWNKFSKELKNIQLCTSWDSLLIRMVENEFSTSSN